MTKKNYKNGKKKTKEGRKIHKKKAKGRKMNRKKHLTKNK